MKISLLTLYIGLLSLFLVGCSSQQLDNSSLADQDIDVVSLASFQQTFDECKSDPAVCNDLVWDSVETGTIAGFYGTKKEVFYYNDTGDPDQDGPQVLIQDNERTKTLIVNPDGESVDGGEYLQVGMSIVIQKKSFHKEQNGTIVEKYGQFYWIQVVE